MQVDFCYSVHQIVECPSTPRDRCYFKYRSAARPACVLLAEDLPRVGGKESLPITAGQDVREQGWLLAICASGWCDGRWISACCSLLCSRCSLSTILQQARHPGIWAMLEAGARVGRPTKRLERRHQAHQRSASTRTIDQPRRSPH
jgi:hypothetical protein